MTDEYGPSRRTGIFLFRAFSIYLLLYFLFISDFASNYPGLWHVDESIKRISTAFGLLLNRAFFNADFREWRFFDSYWTYSKLLAFAVIAVAGAGIWTFADKGRKTARLFIYVYAFSRYYLAVGMLLYSMWKLFETQFYLELKNFLLPVYHIGPRELFWTFMASAKSYSFFGGIVEAISVIFLLFRKTATLGALMAMGVLVNILVLDAAYDTPVKVIVFHLLLFNLVVLWPDALKLYRFFLMNKTETLSAVPSVLLGSRHQTLGYLAKAAFMALVIIPMVKADRKDYNKLNHPYYEKLVGIYEIDPADVSGEVKNAALKSPKDWKKFTVEQGNTSHVLLANDSIQTYTLSADLSAGSIQVNSADSSFRNRFHYRNIDSVHWLFAGISGGDSVRFVARKIDIRQFPLLKENGKIKWSWRSNPFE